MKLSVIVPCYNEEENVAKLHAELLPVVADLACRNWGADPSSRPPAEIIFVDDGSRDQTTQRLRECFVVSAASPVSFKFCRHEINYGLGAAIRTGFAHAEGDIVATVDCDGTYKFSDLPAIIDCLTPGIDIVTASPYHPDGGVEGVPPDRLFLSRSSSLLYRILVDRRIYTYTALFRVYRAAVIKNIPFESNGFLAGTELLVKAILRGYRVVEFPAVLHKRMYGVSKAKIARTIRSHLGFQVRILLYRFKQFAGAETGELA